MYLLFIIKKTQKEKSVELNRLLNCFILESQDVNLRLKFCVLTFTQRYMHI